MGWVMMSERELNRVGVLAQVDDGRLSVDSAANLLDLTRRQIFRLLKRYRQDGASGIRHKARGKPPNNRIHHAKRDYALSVIKESYADFGPTLATEMLFEHHCFKVSRETVSGCRGSNVGPSIRRGCAANVTESLSRLMARITDGLRIVVIPALFSSSSITPPAP